jgi:phage-related protein
MPPNQLARAYNILYISHMTELKPVEFRGGSLDDLRAFPLPARREAGHQLDQVQHGLEPDDWKPMTTVGQGVKEIRIRDVAGAFRVIYVAKLAMPSMYCIASKRRRRSPTRQISNWPPSGTENCRRS